mmetsp:Transcript_14193/g.32252  ORF Transcript_14193/g.32252 Transcript_14193/m.32252 type:complete len:251 (-) Transcript_14193:23-775(-)
MDSPFASVAMPSIQPSFRQSQLVPPVHMGAPPPSAAVRPGMMYDSGNDRSVPAVDHGIPPPFESRAAAQLHVEPDMSMQEIANRAQALQQRIDDNSEREKITLRTTAENRAKDIEKHASEMMRNASNQIEQYKQQAVQAAERYRDEMEQQLRQQAEQASKMVDQQAQAAISAVELRERNMEIQRRQQQESNARIGPRPFVPGMSPASPPGIGAVPGSPLPFGPGSVVSAASAAPGSAGFPGMPDPGRQRR